MRTVIDRRIGGDMVRISITIGVIEAAAEVEPEWVAILAGLQRGNHRLTRAVVTEGVRAAGRAGADAWFDAAVEAEGMGPFVQLAFDAMSDAFAKSADTAKKAEAAAEPASDAS